MVYRVILEELHVYFIKRFSEATRVVQGPGHTRMKKFRSSSCTSCTPCRALCKCLTGTFRNLIPDSGDIKKSCGLVS